MRFSPTPDALASPASGTRPRWAEPARRLRAARRLAAPLSTAPMMPRVLALALSALVLAAPLAGCAGPQEAAGPPVPVISEEEAALLRDEVARLREENADLREALNLQRQSGERGQTVAVLSSDLLFESGSAALSPEAAAELSNVAATLRAQYPGRTIRVEGYTDSNPIGPALAQRFPTNWELSAARAAVVARELQALGFDPARMEVVGLGEYQPLATNATPEGRQQNRRVRIAALSD